MRSARRERTSGSSPRTRGALSGVLVCLMHRGIIPAYAGSTYPRANQTTSHGDHPRVRGEHRICAALAPHAPGSSPRTRGAHHGRQHWFHPYGIIPAYAGSTYHPPQAPCAWQDHPRVRGEHCGTVGPSLHSTGSSPRTRGARDAGRRGTAGAGIIPAYAGSTSPRRGSGGCATDHPRVRGEHAKGAVIVNRAAGIIPAYAGSTCTPRPLLGRGGDHPRVRGEHRRLRIT